MCRWGRGGVRVFGIDLFWTKMAWTGAEAEGHRLNINWRAVFSFIYSFHDIIHIHIAMGSLGIAMWSPTALPYGSLATHHYSTCMGSLGIAIELMLFVLYICFPRYYTYAYCHRFTRNRHVISYGIAIWFSGHPSLVYIYGFTRHCHVIYCTYIHVHMKYT